MAKVLQIIASSGQSLATDAVTGQTLALGGGGSLTLVNDGTYGYLWRLVGGTLANLALTGQGTYGDGYPKTIAFRFRVSSRASGFTRWAIYGASDTTGLAVGNNNAGGTSAASIRCAPIDGGAVVTALRDASRNYTAGDVLTVVMRVDMGATDSAAFWYQTTGRTGTAADASISGIYVFSPATCDSLLFTAATGETLDILDFVAWDTLLTDAQCAQAADDIRAFLVTAGDTMPPVLTAPGGTATGANSATINVTTNEAGGTLYCLVNTSATATEPAVLASSSQAVAASGVQTVNVAGLLPSTVYYPHLVHVDAAGNKSNVAHGGAFTTLAAPATALTLTGPSGGQVGTLSAAFTVGANGTVNGSHVVTPSDAGAGGIFAPASATLTAAQPTATFTYTPASAGAKTITVSDANGYTAPPALTYTASVTAATLTVPNILNGAVSPIPGEVLPHVLVVRRADRSPLLSLANQALDGTSSLVISSGALSAGVPCMVFAYNADGTAAGAWPATPV